MKNTFLFLLFAFPFSVFSQDMVKSYVDGIAHHRSAYKQDFLKDERSPLGEADLPNLRFFEADEQFRIKCTFEKTPDEEPFDLPTYSGITKPYRKYGVLTFTWEGNKHQLAVYQSLRLIRMPQYKDHLFMPFRDLTNGETTYGGGRYIDLTLTEVESGDVYLDFNKCYNPWCGYSDGYNCPIPPTENHLEMEVLAGEKTYAGEKKHK